MKLRKHKFIAVLGAGILAGFVAASPGAVLTIDNSNFDTVPGGGWGGGNAAPEWSNRSAGNNEASDTFDHTSGSGGALKIWAGDGIYVAHQDSSVENSGAIPGTADTWSLSYWAFTPTGDQYTWSTGGNLHIEWFDAGWTGEVAPRDVMYFPGGLTPDTWTEVTGSGSVPAGAANWRFVFEQAGGGTGGGSIYLDDVVVQYEADGGGGGDAVPEPSTAGLLVIGAIIGKMVCRRKAKA
ncbi:MAG: PEP-CTERM sorting domain-containing protein [Verrucomicrobia bacterium]|nr:PEP-CTERM sorting domain-containing protein [Verrucomicrobiota bacterium]